MEYGIIDSGFRNKTYQVLLQELYGRWSDHFGGIDTDPDGAFGQIGESLSLAHAEIWESFLNFYLNCDIRTASGSQLRRLVAMIGMSAKVATKAYATIYVGGDSGTVIPSGTRVIHRSSKKQFIIGKSVTISENNANQINFKIKSGVLSGDVVGFTLNGVVINHTVLIDNEPSSIIYESLKSTILNNSVKCDISSVTIADDSSEIVVVSNIPYRSFKVESIQNGTLDKIYSQTYCECETSGIIVVPQRSITERGTTISGWVDVYNPISGSSGSDDETDTDLRKRWVKATQLSSASTAYAIESKIWQNVRGVSNVLVYTNRFDTTDIWGNPPHSVQITVEGGDDVDIATVIDQSIPVGIQTSGLIAQSINDDIIRFNRTKTLFGWVKVVIKAKNEEEQYPSNGEDLIRSAIYNEALNLIELGQDIVAQRFIGAIYQNVRGLENIEVTVCATGNAPVNPDGLIPIDPNIKNGEPWDYDPMTYSTGYVQKVVVAPTDKVEWRDANNKQRILIIDEVI